MSSPPSSTHSCKNHKRKADSDRLDVCVPTLVRRRRVSVAFHVVGGRTFSGELSRYIIAGYENPRVFRGLTSGDGSHFPAHRKAFCPSQVQTAAVLSKCIPRHLSESFTERFLHHQGLPTASSRTVLGPCMVPSRLVHRYARPLFRVFAKRLLIRLVLAMFLWNPANS